MGSNSLWSDLPMTSQLISIANSWLPCTSLIVSGTLVPQGLCSCHFFIFPRIHSANPFMSCKSFCSDISSPWSHPPGEQGSLKGSDLGSGKWDTHFKNKTSREVGRNKNNPVIKRSNHLRQYYYYYFGCATQHVWIEGAHCRGLHAFFARRLQGPAIQRLHQCGIFKITCYLKFSKTKQEEKTTATPKMHASASWQSLPWHWLCPGNGRRQQDAWSPAALRWREGSFTANLERKRTSEQKTVISRFPMMAARDKISNAPDFNANLVSSLI